MNFEFYKGPRYLYAYDPKTHYLFEVDLIDGAQCSRYEPSVIVDWRRLSKPIKESTFKRYISMVNRMNPFTPQLP